MATLQELTQRVKAAVGEDAGLGKSFKIDLRGEGFIHIDGGAVTNEDKPADLTLSVKHADLEALGRRQLDPMTAVMTGRLKLSDMGLAMSLQPQMQALFSKLG
ncbi:SCP2 sterol-binding domain-containing protein [Phenylobacterium sp. LH3H17]|uniref:SCP2 sterol-binding domain-containing protein n=1 Tax=Phenylobacterium sp. LH3H17 TaxID=2903901 RepID=UPI0020C9F02A|nr:SCP2 sterol-binding domain-containing protein [Phenylobacterium sp. LH3H17]UTP40420.1 SCP2 sterol-binding domain-containing protein [Phenylobacterium sp. LH3H17]